MTELSIAVEHAEVGVHVLRVAGDLDENGSRHLTALIDHIAGLRHAIVDVGNVRYYSDDAFGPLRGDHRITVTGFATHVGLLPGRVVEQLAVLRSARDIESALRQLRAGRPRRSETAPRHSGHAGTLLRETHRLAADSIRTLV